MDSLLAVKVSITYRQRLFEVSQRDRRHSDRSTRIVVRHDGRTQQLPVTHGWKMNIEYNTVIYGQTHQLPVEIKD